MSGILPISRALSTKWVFQNPAKVARLLRQSRIRDHDLLVFDEDVAISAMIAIMAARVGLPQTATFSEVRKASILKYCNEALALPTRDTLQWHIKSATWALVYAQVPLS